MGESAALATMSQGLFPFDHFVGSSANWSASDEFYVYILFGALCLALRGRARCVVYAALALVGYALAVATTVHVQKCVPTADCFNMTLRFGWTRCQFGFFAGTLIAHFRDARIFRILRQLPAQEAPYRARIYAWSDRLRANAPRIAVD